MTMEPMDVVKQTGKTIIFEEFNRDENKMNLVTLLTRDDEDISLEKFKDALMGKDSELVVENFEDFVEKFSPTIYETIVKTGETSKFVYELDKPKYECTQIKLKDHAFYKMIMSLLDRKATSDKGNLEFPYDDLKKALSPEAEMEECKKIRRNFLSNTREYMKLVKSGEPSQEAERFAQNIMACRDKIVDKYQNKSPLALLPLLIADKQSQIDKMKEAEEPSSSQGEVKVIPCNYSFDEKGNICLIEQSYSDEAPSEVTGDDRINQLIDVVRDDFQESAPIAIRENTYIEDLVVNVFVPNGGNQLTTKDRYEIETEKKQLQDIYSSSIESFAKAVATVIEKFAGVKSFFDHALCDGKLARDVSVIISNCRVDAILNDDVAKRRFKKYFSALSAEKDINKIWFGIIPGVAYGEDTSILKKASNPFERRRTEEVSTKKNHNGLVNLDTVKEMLSILNEVKIMTFVNYKAGEKTGFSELTDSIVNGYKKDFENVNSEYAVFTYPNFTILPKEKNTVRIGTEYNYDMGKERETYIVIPGIYLESSYIACGMIVGIQNYRYLQSKGFMVKTKYPCVRFDIEDIENTKRITTKLNRETTTEMLKQTKDAIMEDRFGFVFADNKIIFDGRVINNSYILNARTLKKDNNGKYKPLYKTLVRNFVAQLLRAFAENVTDKSVNQFKTDYVETWKRDNKDDDRKYANRVLLEGETIELDSAKHRLVVTFNKEAEVWDDIVINDSESEE